MKVYNNTNFISIDHIEYFGMTFVEVAGRDPDRSVLYHSYLNGTNARSKIQPRELVFDEDYILAEDDCEVCL